MNEQTQKLAEILKRIKNSGCISCEIYESSEPEYDYEPHLAISYGSHLLFEDDCIFDSCPDEEVKEILAGYINSLLSVDWNITCELMKLLSKRGQLVADLIEPLIFTEDLIPITHKWMFLSYLAVAPKGEEGIINLLDEVTEDFRDGLFLACWKIDNPTVDKKLMQKFIEWDEDYWMPTGTGEIQALGQFLKRWISRYRISELEPLIKIYFKYI